MINEFCPLELVFPADGAFLMGIIIIVSVDSLQTITYTNHLCQQLRKRVNESLILIKKTLPEQHSLVVSDRKK